MMEWLTNVFFLLAGGAAGLVVAGGYFALVIQVGVVSRMLVRFGLRRQVDRAEDSLFLGACLGNLSGFWYGRALPLRWLLFPYGVFAGMFAGCLAVALAEIANSVPIIRRRIAWRGRLCYMMTALAFGKMLGVFLQMVW